jgi:hypothetical protein
VKPAELVTTGVPSIVLLINVVPDELAAGLDVHVRVPDANALEDAAEVNLHRAR